MQLNGKKVAFLGDSITEGVGVEDQSLRYDSRLVREYGIVAANFGISGTRLAHQRTASEKPRFDLCFCGRAYDLPKDSEIIVVFGGTNDYGHGDAPFGTPSDATPESYCGAVRFLMRLLREEYPQAAVIFMTPARRLGDETPLPIPGRCEDKRALVEYVDQILLAGKECGVHVLDLYRTLGVDPNLEADREAYAPDGLHFNDAGQEFIARRLAEFIAQL
ncbi:MAG: SGNH/GDSL hydrolase family protein [Eubacteriales bacterium]|nr:SGNH/GDSL hydrolase family protein [Eubacteriales bacterium]